jgi:hypothetical protein
MINWLFLVLIPLRIPAIPQLSNLAIPEDEEIGKEVENQVMTAIRMDATKVGVIMHS